MRVAPQPFQSKPFQGRSFAAVSLRLLARRACPMMRRALLPVLALALAPAPVFANPEGGTVTAGEAAISGEGTARVLITQTSERALIDWQRFSIGADETTRFVQPDAQALAANRVVGADPSEIFGTLEADGRVVLINRNGVLFGRDARVDTAGWWPPCTTSTPPPSRPAVRFASTSPAPRGRR